MDCLKARAGVPTPGLSALPGYLANEVLVALGLADTPELPEWVVNAYQMVFETALLLKQENVEGEHARARIEGTNTALLLSMVREFDRKPLDFDPYSGGILTRAIQVLGGEVGVRLASAADLPNEECVQFFAAFSDTLGECLKHVEPLPVTTATHRYLALIFYWKEVDQCRSRERSNGRWTERTYWVRYP